MIGKQFAHYEITRHLGTGGMGEVYQATDSKLGRSVAIKLLPETFSRDANRLARFEREARVLASVSHPHIAAIFGLEESGGRKFLVMELAAGETLATRISQGRLPLDEALKIAVQIAEALAAAHEKGVMHRDLKPANIKISADGHVKVLDFGLAKAFEGEAGTANLSNSPTLSMEATSAGVILGTAAYMSPEQAKGRPVDKRTDIFAFGVVLYEMLTGEQLHRGESVSEVLAAVLKETPDLNRVPAKVRPLLRSCLQKDPKQRLHDIADAKLLLEVGGEAEPPRQSRVSRGWIWPAVAAILLLAVVVLGVMHFRETPPVDQKVTTQIPLPEGLTFNEGTQAAISPNGLMLAFPAIGPDGRSRMYLRHIGSLEVTPLPGSEGIIREGPPPFWSYDSRFVIYGAMGTLMKSEITGSPAQTIATTGQIVVQGGTVNRAGVILYANNNGNLMQVPEAGGTPVAVTALAPGENGHRWPQFLPDGRRFLYLRALPTSEKMGIYVGSLDIKPEDQDSKPLLLTNRQAYWVSPETDGRSFLLFQQQATLLAQPFDPTTATRSGTPVPVANEVGSFPTATAGLWSVARTGTLVYRSGGSAPYQFTWRDSGGKITGVLGEPNTYATLALSPDSKKVAFRKEDPQGNSDIYVRNIKGEGNDIHLTTDVGYDTSPVFSPDNKTIVFGANRDGYRDLYVKNADGSGGETLLFPSEQNKTPTSWSRDGRFLLFTSTDPKTYEDLWVLPINSPKEACPFLKTNARERDGQFSGDGSLIAYSAVQLGIEQIFVRPFTPNSPCSASAGTSSPLEISKTDSIYPRWSSNGKRLFFEGQVGTLLVAEVLPGQSFASPRILFPDVDVSYGYAVSAGDQFLFLQQPARSGPPPPFTLVQDWLSGMKK